MQPPDESLQLLREIRDAQQAMLAEYRRVATHTITLQEQAVERQEQMSRLYRRVVGAAAAGVVVVFLLIVYLALRVLRYLP